MESVFRQRKGHEENFFLFYFMRLDYVTNKNHFEHFVIYKFYVTTNYIRIKLNHKLSDHSVDHFFTDVQWYAMVEIKMLLESEFNKSLIRVLSRMSELGTTDCHNVHILMSRWVTHLHIGVRIKIRLYELKVTTTKRDQISAPGITMTWWILHLILSVSFCFHFKKKVHTFVGHMTPLFTRLGMFQINKNVNVYAVQLYQ